MSRHPGETVTKYVFSHVFSQAWERCMTLSNVRGGFKITGVYPFNRHAADKMVGSSSSKNSKYLPMLTPVPPRKQSKAVLSGDHCSKMKCEPRRRHRSALTDFDSDPESREPCGRHHSALTADPESLEPESRQPRRRHCAGSADYSSDSSHEKTRSMIYCSQTKQFLKTPVPPSKNKS